MRLTEVQGITHFSHKLSSMIIHDTASVEQHCKKVMGLYYILVCSLYALTLHVHVHFMSSARSLNLQLCLDCFWSVPWIMTF